MEATAFLGGEYELANAETSDIAVHFSITGQIHGQVRICLRAPRSPRSGSGATAADPAHGSRSVARDHVGDAEQGGWSIPPCRAERDPRCRLPHQAPLKERPSGGCVRRYAAAARRSTVHSPSIVQRRASGGGSGWKYQKTVAFIGTA